MRFAKRHESSERTVMKGRLRQSVEEWLIRPIGRRLALLLAYEATAISSLGAGEAAARQRLHCPDECDPRPYPARIVPTSPAAKHSPPIEARSREARAVGEVRDRLLRYRLLDLRHEGIRDLLCKAIHRTVSFASSGSTENPPRGNCRRCGILLNILPDRNFIEYDKAITLFSILVPLTRKAPDHPIWSQTIEIAVGGG